MNDIPDIPQRSRLFRVELLGRNTGQVECLTSYVARLAASHFTTPSGLLHRVLEWLDVGTPERIGEWRRHTTHLRLRASINAHSSSKRWISVLETETNIPRLGESTVSSWTHLFPNRHLIRHAQAWCPHCLSEDPVPYERLSWNLEPVKVCAKHRCRLVQKCPSCSSPVPTIHARSVSGHCPHCEATLAESTAGEPVPVDGFDFWAAQAVEQLIETSMKRPGDLPQTRAPIGPVLIQCMKVAGLSDAAELAGALNVSRISAWYWLNNKAVPDLEHTLRVAYVFGLSLMDVLRAEISPTAAIQTDCCVALRPLRASPKRFDEPAVLESIKTLRDESSGGPISLEEVGRKVGFEVRTLRQHFPSLCREISSEYRRKCRENVAQRRRDVGNQLKEALLACALDTEHATISRRHISKRLSKPGILRSPANRNTLRQLQMELPLWLEFRSSKFSRFPKPN